MNRVIRQMFIVYMTRRSLTFALQKITEPKMLFVYLYENKVYF